uniref:Uncharacterized protein n=1 Tax=Cacopsylla melanoneura TaxID=428564 RepID=A0A8D8QQ96_9HEMI
MISPPPPYFSSPLISIFLHLPPISLSYLSFFYFPLIISLFLLPFLLLFILFSLSLCFSLSKQTVILSFFNSDTNSIRWSSLRILPHPFLPYFRYVEKRKET